MTRDERQQSLINARRACLILVRYATGDHPAAILGKDHREFISALLEEFGRLDAKERKQAAQGKYGKLGGRPPTKKAATVKSIKP